MIGLHGTAVVLALLAALYAPRAGGAALLVPLADHDLAGVLRWSDAAGAELLALDSASGRVIVRIADNRSLVSALGAGLLPLAARARGCRS